MKILYPYNEILPRHKAHDVYLFQECATFASSGYSVTLLCGKGSKPDADLFAHYGTLPFEIKRLPILRKNTFLNLSWNLPFFVATQREIENTRPDIVFLSVLKQGVYNLNRKVKGVVYVYEVHELKYYGEGIFSKEAEQEKVMLEKTDLIVVTTHALKTILERPPYSLKNRIAVLPLAVHAKPLPKASSKTFNLFYVGQLYQGQGIELLLQAIKHVPDIQLHVVGGKMQEHPGVKFWGFHPPQHLYEIVKEAHAFVAPFQATGRMPYVAHTKLCEYIEWGRAIVAPNLPVVKEHFPNDEGVIYFEPGNVYSLVDALKRVKSEHLRLQKEIRALSGNFTWEKRVQNYTKLLNIH